jgi:hypothetical protein
VLANDLKEYFMKMFKRGLAIFLTSLSMTAAMNLTAAPTNVAGVIIDPDSPFNFTSTSANFVQSFTGSLGDGNLVVGGYGRIDFINGTDQTTFCPGCELTFIAGDYAQDPLLSPNSSGQYEFTGGFVKIFRDAPGNFDISNAATAGDGTLWLDLEWRSIFGITPTVEGLNTSLLVTFSGAGATGIGLLDVMGGTAKDYFDTNTRFNGADIEFQNSFTAGSGFTFGSGNFFGQTKFDVPEPTSLLLLSAGLLGLGFSRKRKHSGM